MTIETRPMRAQTPFADLLDIEYLEASSDRVVAAMFVRADLCTHPAILHDGAMMAFADALGAVGAALNLVEGAATMTIESRTSFLGGAPRGVTVKGCAEPVHRGDQSMVWQTRVLDEDGKLLALVTQTHLVVPPKLT